MTSIRHLDIKNFRGISSASWVPKPGINGLIGPGDSGKSTLLDAIDLVLMQRRTATFSDADFFNLDVAKPIEVTATLGDLPDSLLDLDSYATFFRGWDPAGAEVHPEPGDSLEVVLSMRLTVGEDLEPHWALYSERADADGIVRDLPFAERTRLAPTRLGAFANHHFSWGAKSVLNRVSDERATASLALADAAREARKTFGDRASSQVGETIATVERVAKSAGVRGAEAIQALLDAHGVSFNGGAIALHDASGIPLRNLGIGSARLLVANLQAVAGGTAAISLIDELEHGLEPYRIARLLHTLGSKAVQPARQVFLTTHSPISVRELAARQLWRVRRSSDGVLDVGELGKGDDDQATLRACAEAFLAPNVLVCEGATEIGMARGLDLFWTEAGFDGFAAHGVAIADGGGSNFIARATCFGELGYRTALWRDADVVPTVAQAAQLTAAGVEDIAWSAPNSTEMQLFASLPDAALDAMLAIAVDHCGEETIDQHLANVASPKTVIEMTLVDGYDAPSRAALAKAAGKYKWYKTVDQGERVGREVLGPHLAACSSPVPDVVERLRRWITASTPEAPDLDPGEVEGPEPDDFDVV